MTRFESSLNILPIFYKYTILCIVQLPEYYYINILNVLTCIFSVIHNMYSMFTPSACMIIIIISSAKTRIGPLLFSMSSPYVPIPGHRAPILYSELLNAPPYKILPSELGFAQCFFYPRACIPKLLNFVLFHPFDVLCPS